MNKLSFVVKEHFSLHMPNVFEKSSTQTHLLYRQNKWNGNRSDRLPLSKPALEKKNRFQIHPQPMKRVGHEDKTLSMSGAFQPNFKFQLSIGVKRS